MAHDQQTSEHIQNVERHLRQQLAERGEPAGHVFPSALERLATTETCEGIYSVEMMRPDEDTVPVYTATPAKSAVPVGPEFTDTGRAALLWVLWHHQGLGSPVGQPIRFALGMGRFDRLSDEQLIEAKRWGDLNPHPRHQAGQLPQRLPISTDDEVEHAAKLSGWNNRKYMTPSDYSIWCQRMRRFVELTAPPAQSAVPEPALVTPRSEDSTFKEDLAYAQGWNDCRATMLSAAPSAGEAQSDGREAWRKALQLIESLYCDCTNPEDYRDAVRKTARAALRVGDS